jgi:hypothetical protein
VGRAPWPLAPRRGTTERSDSASLTTYTASRLLTRAGLCEWRQRTRRVRRVQLSRIVDRRSACRVS